MRCAGKNLEHKGWRPRESQLPVDKGVFRKDKVFPWHPFLHSFNNRFQRTTEHQVGPAAPAH